MTVLDLLAAVNGVAQLCAADGQFLGMVSSNQYDLNSICNPNGIYGSTWSIFSIRNPSSLYGSAYGIYSPYNPNSINPPVIIYQGQSVVVVTRNQHFLTNGLLTVDPDLMLSVYGQVAGFSPNLAASLIPPVPSPTVVQTTSNEIAYVSPLSTTLTFTSLNVPNLSGEWQYVTTDITNGDEIAIDPVSFIQQGNVVCFWQRRLHVTPTQQGTKVTLMYVAMDCSTGVWQLRKDIYLNSLGMVTGGSDEPSPLQNTIAGSVGAAVFQCVCQS